MPSGFPPSKRQLTWIVPGLIVLLLAFSLLPWLLKRPVSPAEPESPPANPTQMSGVVKVAITEPGMYKIESAVLKHLGLIPNSPAELRLTNLGQPRPLWYSGDGDDFTLYFFGQPLEDRYINTNVYFLTSGKTSLPAYTTIIELPQPSLALHLEENALYFPKAEPDHTWYWKSLNAPEANPVDFTLPKVVQGVSTLRLNLFSSTEAPNANPDHHLRILVNDTLVLDQTWDGRGSQLLETAMRDGILSDGQNTLTLELPGIDGVLVESILLDWIEIEFPRLLEAENDRLGFIAPAGEVELSGFRTPLWVFDLTRAGESDASPSVVTILSEPRFTPEPTHFYFTAGKNGFLTPAHLTPAQLTPDLRNPETQADYLALGPSDLLQPLQPLLDHRKAQGLSTLAIPIEAIYDQFGDGLPHPMAIRNYLQFAFQTWEQPPTFALLVGDSTYDPAGYQAPAEANRVPSFFLFTFFGGETATDVQFAQLDGDQLPDLAVGRIPARTAEQVEIVVAKTLAYEQNPPAGDWANRVLAIADGQDPSFKADAETFLGHFSDGYAPLLFAPDKGDAAAPEQIERYLDDGVLFMSYFGHGSITMLGKDRIFSNEDGAGLTNADRLPIMINITCLAGLFTHPEVVSLTETMLWNLDGGAVAALSATSLTVPGDQAFLSRALIEAFTQDPDATLGTLLLRAQRNLPIENAGVLEVMNTFLLFGDPALKLP